MNASRDPERLIHAFLLEGAERMDDRVYDAVRAHVDVKRQRAVIGPWRLPTMYKLAPIGLAGAAVVAVLVLGSRFLGPPNTPGGPGDSPSTTPIASPTVPASDPVQPAESHRRDPRPQSLPVGPFLVQDVEASADSAFITVMIPSPGWTSVPSFGGLQKGLDGDPPESAMLLWSWPVGAAFDVYGDPCHWESTRPDTPATTADELAQALAAQDSRDASVPADVALVAEGVTDPIRGKKITLHVPNDAAFETCDGDTFASYGLAGDPNPNRTHQGPGQIDELWILDVNQSVVIIDAMYRPDTPAAVIDEMRSIAESARFSW